MRWFLLGFLGCSADLRTVRADRVPFDELCLWVEWAPGRTGLALDAAQVTPDGLTAVRFSERDDWRMSGGGEHVALRPADEGGLVGALQTAAYQVRLARYRDETLDGEIELTSRLPFDLVTEPREPEPIEGERFDVVIEPFDPPTDGRIRTAWDSSCDEGFTQVSPDRITMPVLGTTVCTIEVTLFGRQELPPGREDVQGCRAEYQIERSIVIDREQWWGR